MRPFSNIYLIFSCFLLLIVGHSFQPLQAQHTPHQSSFYFESVDLPLGEFDRHINTITQDSLGFLWFGSQFGLHRWDGHHLKTFRHNPADSSSIASDYVTHLYVAKNGHLYVGLREQGMDRFNYETGTFQHCLSPHLAPEVVEYIFVSEIDEDKEGNIWVASSVGVYRFTPNSQELKYFKARPEDKNSLSHFFCRSLHVDKQGTVWVGTGNIWSEDPRGGLNKFRPETEDFVHYFHDPLDATSLHHDKVTEIFEDSKGNLWIGTGNGGLQILNRKKGTFQSLQNQAKSTFKLASLFNYEDKDQHISFIFEDSEQKIWIGAWGGGIAYYDPESGFSKTYFHEPESPLSLPEPFPWTMCQTQDGTLWGATTGPGEHLFRIRESLFENHYFSDPNADVYSFAESQDGRIWIGTGGLELVQFDPLKKTLVKYDYNKIQAPQSNLDQQVLPKVLFLPQELLRYNFRMLADEKGRLWISRPGPDGLLRIDPQTGELMAYLHDPADERSLGGLGSVPFILKDKQDHIWAVTSEGVLNLYDEETDRFHRFPFVAPNEGPWFIRIMLANARDGGIWIAALPDPNFPKVLLRKFSPATGTFETFEANVSGYDSSLPFGELSGLIEDDAGRLWLGTKTHVLDITPGHSTPNAFTIKDLGGRFFKGMQMDQQNRIWLFGDQIYLIDPNTKEHFTFKSPFPLHMEPTSLACVYQDSLGRIYFGGVGGIQIIDPQQVEHALKSEKLETVIYDFQLLFDQKGEQRDFALLPNSPAERTIRLPYHQNAFSLRFATLFFREPETNRYQFQLKHYDQDWRESGLEPLATYVKVPPGTYEFKVRGAVRGGDWRPEKIVRIHISPPWWATWWAYSLYVLIFLGGLYAFYKFQLTRRLEKAEADRIKELNKVKERLYTNITHEFRTPLTVIMGMNEKIAGFEKERSLIARNGKNLLRLINQMLGLSKLESGQMKLTLIQADIIPYLRYLTSSFHSMAQNKQIALHFQSKLTSLVMEYDEEKIQHILYNLLSNAIKFTPEGGAIRATVSGSGNQLSLRISDNGVGIPPKQLQHIFDRFYQVDTSSSRKGEGTGIGLTYTKELVELMGGRIAAESREGEGTSFTVSLPVRQDVTKPEQPGDYEQTSISEAAQKEEALSFLPLIKRYQEEKPVVLIIEDNEDIIVYLEALLQADYQVEKAMNGTLGIEKAIEIIPDIIISDVMMPEKDGYEVCKELKKDERTSHIPIILLTAKASTEDRIEGLKEGADAYLTKPFNKEELFVRLERLVSLRKTLQATYSGKDHFVRQVMANAKPNLEDRFLKKLIKVVQDRIDDPELSVNHLCKAAKLSNTQVNRKLKALTNKTPSQFIRSIRLQKALELLENSDLNISEIAYDVGFSDPNYFSRSFSEEFGFAPSKVRK
ncbi:MAG: response regulator [Saprospiraceae bacterium]|nr:response regulator [Saprospiraceae bacterium]